MSKIGRNDPCPCGSGKKHKKCCLVNTAPVSNLMWQKMRRTEGTLIPLLEEYLIQRLGENAIGEAWADFTFDSEVELPEDHPPAEFETFFIPWCLFNWISDDFLDASRTRLINHPVAMLYLQEKGNQLDSFQQRFIETICDSHFSFYVVTNISPGQSLELRDLILNKTISVYERQGSESITVGSIIFARILTMDNSSIMVGSSPYLIPADYQSYFIDLRENWQTSIEDLGDDVLSVLEFDIREIYHEIIEKIKNAVPPKLINNEGDMLEFSKLHYQLDCSVHEAFSALQTLAISISEKELLDDGKFDSQGSLKSIEFPWLEKLGTEKLKMETTVKGTLVISVNKLTVSVNSRERAEEIKHKISRRLGKRATFKNAVIQSTAKMLNDMPSGNPIAKSKAALASQELESKPEIQAMLKEMAAKHWKDWLDIPIPALQNKTPRESAKTARGLERLDALFLQFKGMSNDTNAPFNPDINALKKELGIK
jgi:hypothetical protein